MYLACGDEHDSIAGVRVGGNVIEFSGCCYYGGDHGALPSDCENDHEIDIDEHGSVRAPHTQEKLFLKPSKEAQIGRRIQVIHYKG